MINPALVFFNLLTLAVLVGSVSNKREPKTSIMYTKKEVQSSCEYGYLKANGLPDNEKEWEDFRNKRYFVCRSFVDSLKKE